jgi:hypothetical protein
MQRDQQRDRKAFEHATGMDYQRLFLFPCFYSAAGQHIPPAPVITADRQVIGHDVQYLAEPVGLQGGVHRIKVFFRAELWIERIMVDDILTMRAHEACLQIRKCVKMADA